MQRLAYVKIKVNDKSFIGIFHWGRDLWTNIDLSKNPAKLNWIWLSRVSVVQIWDFALKLEVLH